MSDYDIAVIGAGYGGVTLAALCAKAGKRVLLIDKNPQAGGKAMTIERRGYRYEMWPVLGTPASGSRFHELAAELGVEDQAPLLGPEVAPGGVGSYYKNAAGEWRIAAAQTQVGSDPMGMVESLKDVYGATDDDIAAMGEMFAALMGTSDEELDALDEMGSLQWFRSFNLPEPLITFLAALLNYIFVAPVNRIPVSETIRTLRDLFVGTGGRYAGGGFGRLAELAADYVVAHGGTFLTNARVEKVVIENGRAVGVATNKGEFTADAVVSNAGIQPTILKLVGEGTLPDDYVKWVMDLEPGLAFVGVRYFLDAPVFSAGLATAYSDQSWWDDERYAAAQRGEWPDASLVFVGATTNYDPTLAPEGHQIALLGTLGSPDPKATMNDEAIRRLEATVAEIWPEVSEHIIRREPYSASQVASLTRDSVVPGAGGECIGLAQVIGQCGRSKPDPRTPLPGLYLVGCDAGGYGCGTHQAVDSGFKVTAMVLEDLGG